MERGAHGAVRGGVAEGAGVVLIVLIARDEVDDVMDGFVYGALCGLGFAVVEDVFYFLAVFGGDVGGVFRVLRAGDRERPLLPRAVHGARRDGGGGDRDATRGATAPGPRRIAALLAGTAVFAHFLWNSPMLEFFPAQPWEGAEWLLIPVATTVKGLPLLLFVVIAVRLAHGRERRWLRETLAREFDDEAVTAEELAVLESPRRRAHARRELKRRAGDGAADLLKRLQREQINLAMVRSRVASDDDPALLRQRALCRSLRDALEAIPGAASAAGTLGSAPIGR